MLRKMFCKLSAGCLQISIITDVPALPPPLPQTTWKTNPGDCTQDLDTHSSSLATHVQNTFKKTTTTLCSVTKKTFHEKPHPDASEHPHGALVHSQSMTGLQINYCGKHG